MELVNANATTEECSEVFLVGSVCGSPRASGGLGIASSTRRRNAIAPRRPRSAPTEPKRGRKLSATDEAPLPSLSRPARSALMVLLGEENMTDQETMERFAREMAKKDAEIETLRSKLRRQSQELERARGVVEAARVVAAGWLNGRTISGERDSMNKLIASLAQPAPEKQ